VEESAQHVDVLIADGGQPGGLLTDDRVTGGPQTRDGGVDVAGVPQHHGVEHQAEHAELVFLAFPVCLPQLAGCPWNAAGPALRRGDHLHARLRPGPGEPLRHLLPRAIQRAGQVPQVLSAGTASPRPVRISA
jgi:hypothetical protein